MRTLTRTLRTVRALLLGALLAVTATPTSEAQTECVVVPDSPDDLEPCRKWLVDNVMPLPKTAYGLVCGEAGGTITANPPVVGETTGIGCSNPWCSTSHLVGVYCLDRERLQNPKPGESPVCLVYQSATPRYVTIPSQDVVGPIQARCLDPGHQTTFVGGWCTFAVEVLCFRQWDQKPCYVFSTAVGCVSFYSGACTQAVQTFCWGHVYVNGQKQYSAFCIAWVAAAKHCVTLT